MKGWRPLFGSSHVVYKSCCTYTRQCLHFIDDLDECISFSSEELDRVISQVDPGGALHKVVEHLTICSICVEELLRARQERQQQRRLLMAVLANSEAQVPSTSSEIIAAVWKEPQGSPLPPILSEDQENQKDTLFVLPFHSLAQVERWKRNSPVFNLVSVVSLVSATVLVLWSSFSMLNGARNSTQSFTAISSLSIHARDVSLTASPTLSLSPSHSWSSILFTHVASDGKSQVIEDYDIANGKNAPLSFPACCSGTVVFDSLSHNGNNYVFHMFVGSGKSTIYYIRTGRQFSLEGKGSNVVWSTDDRFLFATDGMGRFWRISVQNGQESQISMRSLQVSQLLFARDTWLYFQAGGTIYRLDTSSSAPTPLFVLDDPSVVPFGLDPRASTLYFSKRSATGQSGVYAQDTITNKTHLLYTGGLLVGYDQDSDDSLMIVRQLPDDQSFQLVEYNPTTAIASAVATIAPGASTLCDGNVSADTEPICASSIAYSPFERQLVVEAGYADGSHKVWSIDWQDKTTTPLAIQTSSSTKNVGLQLIGWDTLRVG